MNIEEFREYCLTIKGAAESFPFKQNILVFKVMDKMFAYIHLEPKDGIFKADMKCDPEKSANLRNRYEGVNRGTHTTYLTWNTVMLENDVPDKLIKQLIQHSVEEVIKQLPKKKQQEYNEM
ncbi:MmcQ/YjbR family DNA-binding protein [Dysgonomonas sp. 25]|uniref:MmcQ/YjbR family DNA-binding protein n=1 Tax=Dysgonomonas sp. 25 TaxID=2302933 RepID=UPI0013D07673|nr:MmcQ/YjbR family DNA-binding protein [Dysgonomonas sp. 25]NDV69258.1 MmcQ/YjbR family DNA-binding protein [Dysgonomonas sp. 25]